VDKVQIRSLFSEAGTGHESHALMRCRNVCCSSQVVVATGFIAKNPAGQVTTLRRNGSDYSATIMGALVLSSNIVIWTDVNGVYSADPRKVSELLFLMELLLN